MARCKHCERSDYGSVPGGPELVVCNSCGTYYANDDAGGRPVTVDGALLDQARADANAEKAAARAAATDGGDDDTTDDGGAADEPPHEAEAALPDGVPALPSNQYYCVECGHNHVATSALGVAHAPAL